MIKMIGSMNLEGELLLLVEKYNKIQQEEKKILESKEDYRNRIIEMMTTSKLTKLRSQNYSVALDTIKPNPKIAEKKLHDEIKAINREDLWEKCLYNPNEYTKLTVKLLKNTEVF